ncbi:hypothetical protein CEXT_459861 [Caerostris extrusa]|uniref:Uncharacterized protein n=1 Tax=Caerostris extrusa TaxID=172846 RepID=A0AAV4UDN8_CAEEX|nr:hypothetical protein CEXT_459861 [Caerostris extrusa]
MVTNSISDPLPKISGDIEQQGGVSSPRYAWEREQFRNFRCYAPGAEDVSRRFRKTNLLSFQDQCAVGGR